MCTYRIARNCRGVNYVGIVGMAVVRANPLKYLEILYYRPSAKFFTPRKLLAIGYIIVTDCRTKLSIQFECLLKFLIMSIALATY